MLESLSLRRGVPALSAGLCLKLLALLLWTATFSFGQAVNATLLGTVSDSSGGAIANGRVRVTETNTSVSHSTLTNESGNYTFRLVRGICG